MTAHTWTACSGSGSGSKGRCFSSLQAECLLTRRTPPVCWGCVAELWCFSPSRSSGTRLTLCKKHFQFWPLWQFSCCSYIHWMLVDVIIYKIQEWIHFLWKLWRPSEDTFFAQIIDFLSLMWIDSSPVLDFRAGSSILFPSVKKKNKWNFKEHIFALVSHMKKTHSQ